MNGAFEAKPGGSIGQAFGEDKTGGTKRQSRSGDRTRTAAGTEVQLPSTLHEMREDDFEELGRDLMSREPTVSEARLFRKRGLPQFGVDVVCTRRFDDGCEVAQLKRYAAFGRAEIRAACDLFSTT